MTVGALPKAVQSAPALTSVDHSTIARWVLTYAPFLNRRIRSEMRHPGRSWCVDETYVRVAGQWAYLYRTIDSTGNTIGFLLSPERDVIAAKGFLQLALWQAGQFRPRVINVDGHPAYTSAIEQLKCCGDLSPRCRCRRAAYLNNILEQDHRFVNKRILASQWFRSVDGALNTIAVYEAMNIIRKGQIRWVAKNEFPGPDPIHRAHVRHRRIIPLSQFRHATPSHRYLRYYHPLRLKTA